MARYQGADASFDVPSDWEDKSIVAFSAPRKPGAIVPNVVMTKDKMKADEKLEQYVDRTIVDMASQLAGFALIAKDRREIEGALAIEVRYSWSGSGGRTLVQRILMVEGVGKKIVGLNVTCDRAEAKKVEPIADRIIASFRLSAPA